MGTYWSSDERDRRESPESRLDRGRTAEQVIKATARLVNAHGMEFRPKQVGKIVRRNLRRGDLDAALAESSAYIRRTWGIDVNDDGGYLRAVSLECRDNPYVARWLQRLNGGLPN